MTLDERKEKAVYLKHNGCNCAQAVLMSYSDILGLNDELLLKISSGFGQGMGCMKATCGALIGAVDCCGILNDTGVATKFLAKEMIQGFEEKSGATICEDLKGIKTRVVLCSCEDCIRNAIDVMDTTLNKYKK